MSLRARAEDDVDCARKLFRPSAVIFRFPITVFRGTVLPTEKGKRLHHAPLRTAERDGEEHEGHEEHEEHEERRCSVNGERNTDSPWRTRRTRRTKAARHSAFIVSRFVVVWRDGPAGLMDSLVFHSGGVLLFPCIEDSWNTPRSCCPHWGRDGWSATSCWNRKEGRLSVQAQLPSAL